MKKLLLVLLLLLAAPALAQTGDCTAETGTSTAWEILDGGTGQGFVVARYTFYAAGLLGQAQVTRRSSIGDGVDASVFADLQCEAVDKSREADEWIRAAILVQNNPNASTVFPAYPEVCPAPPVTPSSPPGTAADYCRTSLFHQSLVRKCWPLEAVEMRDCFLAVWEWVTRSGPQGPGFNTGQEQAWLGVTASEWSSAVSPRMSNMEAITTGIDEDEQWRRELGNFQ